MKKQISCENIQYEGFLYTRIKWSDGNIVWFYGFDNKSNNIESKETIILEEIYQKTFNEN